MGELQYTLSYATGALQNNPTQFGEKSFAVHVEGEGFLSFISHIFVMVVERKY